jgi:hypothetical protein
LAGGLAGMIGNPTEVANLVFDVIAGLTVQTSGSSGADVCRWSEATSPEIRLLERDVGFDPNWKRRRIEDFHERIGAECGEKYFDE